jgi:hypothetical protein
MLAGSAAVSIGLLDLLNPSAGTAAAEKPEDPFEGVYVKPALSLQAYLDQVSRKIPPHEVPYMILLTCL